MANRNSFKKGTIELLLLSILRVEDCYGYQITQKIREQSDGAITVTEGALYPILYKLSDKGYVSDYKKLAGKRLTRVYYHLEQAGSELDNLVGVRTRQIQRRLRSVSTLPEETAAALLSDPGDQE